MSDRDPIDVEVMHDPDGWGPIGCYSRGHVDASALIDAARSGYDLPCAKVHRPVSESDVRHAWMRKVPVSGDPAWHWLVEAQEPGPGAFKVTVFDVRFPYEAVPR